MYYIYNIYTQSHVYTLSYFALEILQHKKSTRLSFWVLYNLWLYSIVTIPKLETHNLVSPFEMFTFYLGSENWNRLTKTCAKKFIYIYTVVRSNLSALQFIFPMDMTYTDIYDSNQWHPASTIMVQ